MPFYAVARRNGRVVGRKHTANPKFAAQDVQRLRLRFSAPVDISIEYDDGSSASSTPFAPAHSSKKPYDPAFDPTFGAAPKAESHAHSSYSQSAGSVLIDARGRVLLRQPTNQFGGYQWTFGKGGIDEGETPEQAAVRETLEELGWDAEIVAPIDGKFKSQTTETVYFLMRPIAENLTPAPPHAKKPGPFPGRAYPDWETAALTWCSEAQARTLLSLSSNAKGRARDLHVLDAAFKLWRSLKE